MDLPRFLSRLPLCLLVLTLAAFIQSGGPSSARADQGPEGAAGRIINIRGLVEVFPADGRAWQRAAAGTYLAPGDALRTGAAGWAAVLMADESMIQLARNSSLVLKQIQATAGWYKNRPVSQAAARPGKSVYQVKRGRIWLRNKSAKPSIGIQTPTVTASIRGTELGVEVEGNDTVRVTVLEGLVLAANDTGSLAVKAGEQVTARPGQPLKKTILLNPEEAVQWTLSLPPLFTGRELPLVSPDARFLRTELKRLEAAPSSPANDLALARVCRDLGLTDRADQLLAAPLAKDLPGARLTLGWLRLDQGRYTEALAAFDRAGGSSAGLGRAAALYWSGRENRADRTLTAALKARPDAPELKLFRAYLLMTDGYFRRAEGLLDELTGLKPVSGPAWGLKTLAALSANRNQDALASAQAAIRAAPNLPFTWLCLAYARQAAYDLPGALAATDKALGLDKNNVAALTNRARLDFGLDRLEAAWASADRARRLAPQDAQVWNLFGFLELTQRRHQAALKAFEKALSLNPGLAEPHLGLGLVGMRLGQVDQALKEVSTAVLLEPRRALLLSYWGKMLYQIGRRKRALEVLDIAAGLDPNDPTPSLYRAIILRDLNRPTEAIDQMNRAVALNNNRAVYRSRFLLDRDLAVKNVALSILYDSLGLEAWAFNRATASIKQDYMNSAGHKFLAGALGGMEGRDRAAQSEELLARLLEPVNQNAFNTFNEYTSFFEQPYLNGYLEGRLGTQSTYSGGLHANAALPRAGLAATANASTYQDEGWRGDDGYRDGRADGRLKWQINRSHSIMAAGSFSHVEQDNKFYPRYSYSDPGEPYDKQEIDQSKAELGYRWRISPRTDLLAVGTYAHADGWFYQRQSAPSGYYTADVYGKYFNEEPYWQGQLQLQHAWGHHQFIAGTVQYFGSHKVTKKEFGYLTPPSGSPIFIGSSASSKDLNKRFQSYYLQDTWDPLPWLTVEAALYYDRIDATNSFFGTSWATGSWGPRLGLILRPTKSDTLRLAAFRYLLPFDTSRIDPMDIGGVTLFRNAVEASVAQEADLVWEHTWSSGFLSANLFYVTRDYTYTALGTRGESQITEKGRMAGFEAAVNQLVWQGIGLRALYRFTDVSDEGLPQADRRDHLASLRASWLHHSGLSASLTQSYRFSEMTTSGLENQSLWLTDASLGFELPGKRGKIELIGRNLFNNRFDWVTDFFVTQGRAPAREIILYLRWNF